METSVKNHTPPPEQQVATDFFQGNLEAGLESIRLRLLDLTNRNRLLNFRHTMRSSLRVVDELPDQLFEVLADGKELRFKPVPRPRRKHWIGADDNGAGDELAVAREPTPARTREPQQRRLPTAREYAESLGIPTSFDLPRLQPGSDAIVVARHADREIQTLHYPDELEAILRSIASSARLAIEETGTNMLYLAMGFLEWYESEDSHQERLAPLVLVPVSLERGAPDAQTQAYRYSIRRSGEDIVANISLQEKLRRDFYLEVPEVEEEDAPESYFQKVERIIGGQERWRVRRQITLTLLSFGKVLMYRDLDPGTWPNDGGPAQHPRIREFFEGIQQKEIKIAPDYRIDDPRLSDRVPLLIDDADSSQHSALVDAMRGKNLVIQGPPGTGKSQTITNLIAAAMAEGKTVLFVSEKLAALEVVRDRLNRAGLGIFCLELHSHKTRKRALLDDLEARIDARTTFVGPGLLDQKITSLEQTKQRLTEYVDLINTRYGQLGRTVYDVLWWCRRCRSRLPVDPERIEKLVLTNAKSLTLPVLEERRQLLRAYGSHLGRVLETSGDVWNHPWYGVTSSQLDFLEVRPLVESLEDIRRWAQELAEWAAALETATSFSIEPAAGPASSFVEAVSKLPSTTEQILRDLVPALSDPEVRTHLKAFEARVAEHRRSEAEIVEELGSVPSWDGGQADRIKDAAALAIRELRDARSIEDAAEGATALEDASRAVDGAAAGAREVTRWLARDVSLAPDTLGVLRVALDLARGAPVHALHRRHPGLENDNAVATLQAALHEAEPLREGRADLSRRVHLRLVPQLPELRRHASAAANARWWSFLVPSYRAAKRAYLAMAHGPGKPTPLRIRQDLQWITIYLTRLQRFAANRIYREVAGDAFAAIDTPLHELLALAEWRVAIRRRLEFSGTAGRLLGSALWTAPSDGVRGLHHADQNNPDIAVALLAAKHGLATAQTLLGRERGPEDGEELPAYAKRLRALATQIADAATLLRQEGFADRHTLASVAGHVDRVLQLHALRAELDDDEEARRVLGSYFEGVNTDFEAVAHTIAFVDHVMGSAVPDDVKRWLLGQDTAERLQDLRARCSAAKDALTNLAEATDRFSDVAELDTEAWFAGVDPKERASFATAVERADLAVAARGALPEWLDYVQARERALDTRLELIIDLAEQGTIRPADLAAAFDFVLSNSLAKAIFTEHPTLARFSGLSHDELRDRFGKLDREIIELTRARVAATLDRRPVPMGIGTGRVRHHTEFSLIDREISKQKRHIPIRQLVDRAGRALQALKPCFMMGPLSVAQYLPPGKLEFDLVVMDEASQLKPEDALGAICRAKQVVVVGDPMQLPPTSFFDRIGDDDVVDDEDAQPISDAESILDVASQLYKPTRLLRWHYRSRHASLIAFSNKEFYDKQLIVFPSPLAKSPEYGIKFVHVPDGVYESGRNKVEADRVVEAAFTHMRNRPQESLGIATMNGTQRDVVENELEQRLKSDPHAQRFVDAHEQGLEPLFVKNLENVQGDERDVIFVSVTYGPNENGRVFQRFGPINHATGHRRLNVLFTRARTRLAVFSSMRAEDIVVDPVSSPWGVRALRAYLDYAETGNLEQATFTGREPDSDFEVEVADALRSRGHDVVAQVGVAGYFLDLGVKHPRKPDAFVLGIECDGATYHSGRSARDRDRLRQAILEDLGWEILRIWSTDWFKDRAGQVDRIDRRVQEILEEEGGRAFDETYDPLPDESDAKSSVQATSEAKLSPEQARRMLIEFREQVIELRFPNTAPSACILRDHLIAALLRLRPRDHSDWLERIPYELRIDTDFEQTEFLEEILDIVARVSA